MKPAPANRPVTCPYGKKGSAWATGEHGGIDYGTPVGDPIYAPWSGTVTGVRTPSGTSSGTTWGSAYGGQVVIDFDKLPDGSAGLWGVLAHLSATSVTVGQRVTAGQRIGTSGATGNVSGPHAHFEIQGAKSWQQGNYRNPQPWVDAGAAGGPTVTANIYSDKLGMGEPTNGDSDSDTVKELQVLLGVEPVSGRYLDLTDAAVRAWQASIGNTPDPPGQSYLGPKQRELMFASPPYIIIDRGLPACAGGTSSGTTLGRWLAEQGFTVHDSNVPLGRASTWTGAEYLLVHHTGGGFADPADMAAYCRTGTDIAPLYELLVDAAGEIWVCAQERDGQPDPGRASHAGEGSWPGVPDDRMNERSVGVAGHADGTKPLSAYPQLYATLVRLLRALADRYQVPTAKILGHKEWSSTGKKDPLDDMNRLRSDVDAGTAPNPPEPPMSKNFIYSYGGKPSGTQTAGTSYLPIDASAFTPPGDGLLLAMQYVNCAFTLKSGVDTAGIRIRSVRAPHKGQPADYSAYQDYTVTRNGTTTSFLITHLWFEMAEANRKIHFELDRASAFSKVTLGTRYTKYVWISKALLDQWAKAFGVKSADVATSLATYFAAANAEVVTAPAEEDPDAEPYTIQVEVEPAREFAF